VMILLSNGPDAFKGGWHWEAAGLAAFEGVFSVSVSLLVLDRFRRHHAHQGRLGRRLARASYGAFVVQGPVLVFLALALRPTSLSGDVKFIVLASAAVMGSFALAAGVQALTGGRHQPATR
jgi:peptidoglycan/LPS O-acetylase OafA/YrhL